jgi:hypothetical protein
MSTFKQLEGDEAIIYNKGLYKPLPLYSWRGALFVKVNGGFARLHSDGSVGSVQGKLIELHYSGSLHKDDLGRLCTSEAERTTALAQPEHQKLLGISK